MDASRCDGLSPGFKRVQGSNGRLVKNEGIPVDKQASIFCCQSEGRSVKTTAIRVGLVVPTLFVNIVSNITDGHRTSDRCATVIIDVSDLFCPYVQLAGTGGFIRL
jgi:hypothetical protein